MNRRFFVYILTNGPRGVLYVGVTNDLIRRLTEQGQAGSRIYKGVRRRPARLLRRIFIYSGSSSTRSDPQALPASVEDSVGG